MQYISTATKIPFMCSQKRITRPQSQFLHPCVCERFIQYLPRIGPHIFLQQNRQTDRGNLQIAYRHMNVEIGTEGAQFLFWEYICFEFSVLYLCSEYVPGVYFCRGSSPPSASGTRPVQFAKISKMNYTVLKTLFTASFTYGRL
jgi:hypothetical protein